MYPGERYAKISVYNLKMQKFTKGLVQITDLLEPPLCIMDYGNFLEPPPPPIICYTKGGGSNKSLRNNPFCKLMYPGERYAKISVYNLKMQKFTKGLVQITDLLEPPLCIMDYGNFLEPPPPPPYNLLYKGGWFQQIP